MEKILKVDQGEPVRTGHVAVTLGSYGEQKIKTIQKLEAV